MTRPGSAERGNTYLARTADGSMVIIGEADGQACTADVVIVERSEGRSEIARVVGRLAAGNELSVEARIVGTYRIAAEGQAVGDLLDELSDHAQEGHGWGSLGLPQGLETCVVASTTDGATSDYAMARSSSSAVALEHHPTLKLAPGDRGTVGGCSGVVNAIDHRAGTIELQVDDGEYVIISTVELHGTGEQEQET